MFTAHFIFRFQVIISGYVYEEISKEPPIVEVTFVVCTDMNGSIPQKVRPYSS